MQPMPTEQFHTIMATLVDSVRTHTVAERMEHVALSLGMILRDGEDDLTIDAAVIGDVEHRHALFRAVGRRYGRERKNVCAAIMVEEAWMAPYGSQEEIEDGPLPSERADKEEVVVVAGNVLGEPVTLIMLRIERDPAGIITDLVPMGAADVRVGASYLLSEFWDGYIAGRLRAEPVVHMINRLWTHRN